MPLTKNITTDRYHYFLTDPCSQWYPSEFTGSDGTRYECAEQFMMRSKALLFGDQETAAKIMATSDPSDMKALGRSVAGYDEAVWVQHREAVVDEASILKFSQNSGLWKHLDGLGERELVEAAHYDRVWGVGLNADDCAAIEARSVEDPRSQWKGLNLLGESLMDARAHLRAHPELIPADDGSTISMRDAAGQRDILLRPQQAAQILGLDLQGFKARLESLPPGRTRIQFKPFVKDPQGMSGDREDMLAKVEIALRAAHARKAKP